MTSQRILIVSLVAAAIGNGLVAGVFFAFSSFVMPALARIGPVPGVQAMQSINVTVVRSLFHVEFIATTILSAALIVAPWFITRGMAPRLASVAGVVSVFGSFGVTTWLDVPLNDRLAAATPAKAGAATRWGTFLHDWGAANTGRIAASTIASLLFVCAALTILAEW